MPPIVQIARVAQIARVTQAPGFIAALDQSGGSTPAALRQYGAPDDAYTDGAQTDEARMFALIQQMRERIMTSPAFTGTKILAAILFDQTMDSHIQGRPLPAFLWEERQIAAFLKIDQGLELERDGVRLMKPIPNLDGLLARAAGLGVIGTKMRSVINAPSPTGVAAVVAQQFALAARIAEHGLLPIVEPEISLDALHESAAETLLSAHLRRALDALPPDRQVILKLSLPSHADFYADLAGHPRVARLLALSGGYSRAQACARLSANHHMIASFSRALLEDLRYDTTPQAFDAALAAAVDQIYRASVDKGPGASD